MPARLCGSLVLRSVHLKAVALERVIIHNDANIRPLLSDLGNLCRVGVPCDRTVAGLIATQLGTRSHWPSCQTRSHRSNRSRVADRSVIEDFAPPGGAVTASVLSPARASVQLISISAIRNSQALRFIPRSRKSPVTLDGQMPWSTASSFVGLLSPEAITGARTRLGFDPSKPPLPSGQASALEPFGSVASIAANASAAIEIVTIRPLL
jgi:hypothetical protein